MSQITSNTVLVLASGSPRRRELLERIGMLVEVRPASIDESPLADEDAVSHARRLAAEKASSVAGDLPERWVLAADTVVEIDERILGKAADAAEARSMLAALVGRAHRVTTGFALSGPGTELRIRHVTSVVEMRPVPADELDDYVAAGEWQGKAGAYAVQGMAAAMVTAVRGSITNVVGLPLAEVIEELRSAGAGAPRYAAGRPA